MPKRQLLCPLLPCPPILLVPLFVGSGSPWAWLCWEEEVRGCPRVAGTRGD